MKPKVCILRTDGTNCDEELYFAFEKFGGAPEYVHVNELRSKSSPSGVLTKASKRLTSYQILALPGGFAYGDDVASGKILAVELISFLKDQLREYIYKEGLILGVCNGFQVLVRTGLLPYGKLGKMAVTLAQNESGHFECRWVKIKIEKSRCVFLNPNSSDPGSEDVDDPGSSRLYGVVQFAVNHGEGKFYAHAKTLAKIESENLVVFRYVDENSQPTQKYPHNPNGAINAIAGITDPTGRVLGIMPHPEKIVEKTQHPNWRRGNVEAKGGIIFEGLIKFAQQS